MWIQIWAWPSGIDFTDKLSISSLKLTLIAESDIRFSLTQTNHQLPSMSLILWSFAVLSDGSLCTHRLLEQTLRSHHMVSLYKLPQYWTTITTKSDDFLCFFGQYYFVSICTNYLNYYHTDCCAHWHDNFMFRLAICPKFVWFALREIQVWEMIKIWLVCQILMKAAWVSEIEIQKVEISISSFQSRFSLWWKASKPQKKVENAHRK